MSDGRFGLTEAVSVALGGMIGGGIYAVLGVVTQITGAATWFAFVLAGIVALCAGYSYIRLNELVADEDGTGGGSVTFVQSFTGNSDLAGMVGGRYSSATSARWPCTHLRSENSLSRSRLFPSR